jgi:hypothetical protein
MPDIGPGMRELESHFETLAASPELSFLRRRGVFFMNQFLQPDAPSVKKGESRKRSSLVLPAQSTWLHMEKSFASVNQKRRC